MAMDQGLYLDPMIGGVEHDAYNVVTGGGDPVAYEVTRMEAHDVHGVTLYDCEACQGGEGMLHAFESRT